MTGSCTEFGLVLRVAARWAGGMRTMYHIGWRAPIPRPSRHGVSWDHSGLDVPVDEPVVFLTPNPLKVAKRHSVGGSLFIYDVPQWVIAESGGVHHYDHAPEVMIRGHLWRHVRIKGKMPVQEWIDPQHASSIPGGFPVPKVKDHLKSDDGSSGAWRVPVRDSIYWDNWMRQKKHPPTMTPAGRVAARYKNKKTIKTKDGDDAIVYEYSDRQVQHRNREKAKQVEKLRKSIGGLRKQVQKDITSEDDHIRAVALAVGLMDATYERVGNDQSAKDGHYGVTGWLVKHVTFGKGKATVKYVGKSGVKHEKVIDTPASVKALKEAVKGKGDNDEIVDCNASDVNEYLKPFDVTAKDLRGFHANTEMQTRLKAVRSKGKKLPEDKKEREKQLKDEFKQALEETAEAVGHESATLKSQYLVPGMEDAFLKDGTVSEKLNKHGSQGLKVWLDDVRPTPPGWVHARWPEDAIRYLQTGRVTEISLDHDLGDDDHGTGNDVVTWIEEQVYLHGFVPPAVMKVHSDNAAGIRKMHQGIAQIYRLYERLHDC